MTGFVYLMSNEGMPGLLKAGTSKNPCDRQRQLRKTGVPTPFKLEWAYLFKNPEEIEQNFHEAFPHYRVATDREFFKMGLEEATSFLDDQITYNRCNVESFDVLTTMHDELATSVEKALKRGVTIPEVTFHIWGLWQGLTAPD